MFPWEHKPKPVPHLVKTIFPEYLVRERLWMQGTDYNSNDYIVLFLEFSDLNTSFHH